MKQQGYLWSVAAVAALCAIAGIAPAHAASYVPGDDVFVGAETTTGYSMIRTLSTSGVRLTTITPG
jgi:hypothetical protein